VPITLSNADFNPIDGYSEPLRLAGAYTLTVTADKPGEAEVLIYERPSGCQQIYNVIPGAGASLPLLGTIVTKRQPQLEDGCYSLYLNTPGGVQVTVTLSR
jgi:hypothetical protein